MIVCDCDTIIKPKRIKTITVQYVVDSQSKNPPEKNTEKPTINQKIIDQATQILKTYGFTSSESTEIITKYTTEEHYDSVKPLIEMAISATGFLMMLVERLWVIIRPYGMDYRRSW